MKKPLLLFLALLLGGLHAHADQDSEDQAERRRISAERSRVEAGYAAQGRDCRQKFAVDDCVNAARSQRREALADLRRQEVSLNDAQRRRRGSDRLHVIEERTASQAEDDAARKRAGVAAQTREREARAGVKAAARADVPPARDGKPAVAAEPPVQRTVDESANLRRHQERQDEAREHRENVQKRQAQRKKPPAAPLPEPS